MENLSLYGLGEKVSDVSYAGIGFKYDSDYSAFIIEKSDDYKRISIVQRIDINNRYYTKIGLNYLTKDETIYDVRKDITQVTLGEALGYGNDKDYNLELGYIVNKLTNRGLTDTTSRFLYAEGVLKYDIGILGSVDGSLSYQSARTYDETVTDYDASLAYYPIEDIKLWTKYTNIEHDEDNYKIISGINYKFDGFSNFTSGIFSHYLSATSNLSKNTEVTFDFKEDIANRSLKIRDKFEEQINTNSIIAKDLDYEEFEKRITSSFLNTFATLE